MGVHKEYNLHVTPKTYVFEVIENDKQDSEKVEYLIVDRKTGAVSVTGDSPLPSYLAPPTKVYGILGSVQLASIYALVIITSVSALPSASPLPQVYSAKAFQLLPITTITHIPAKLPSEVDRQLCVTLHTFMETTAKGMILFSLDSDLTHSLERKSKNQEAVLGEGKVLESVDDRLCWNKALLQNFYGDALKQAESFILPVIFGSCVIKDAVINAKPFKFVLISRRSRLRAGTRYFRRGIDKDGNTANFNETEQIIIVNDEKKKEVYSFLQIRGSAPIFWAQINNLRYQPDIQVMELPETPSAIQAHIDQLKAQYNEVYLVNLVNHKGYEAPVKLAFERAMAKLNDPKAHYQYFDFHTELKGMKFEKVHILIDSLSDSLDKQGYFQQSFSDSPKVNLHQTSVVRTNCMDSLDRTNVVQAALAKHMLNKQLQQAGILGSGETVEAHPDFIWIFRNVWADHADSISIPYSGTGALKTGFTRTGKRTKKGALDDGINSAVRYIQNNFFDGQKQDAYDLLTGAWSPKEGDAARLAVDPRPLAHQAMPYALFFSIAMIMASWVLPRKSQIPLIYYIFFWASVATVSLAFIVGNGIEFVNWPILNPLDPLIYYKGPGFKKKGKGRGMSIPLIAEKRRVKID